MNTTEIIKKYNAFLVDIWGTIHSGGILYKNTQSTLKSMMSQGYVLLLSNAPRQVSKVEKFLESIGITKGEHYHEILTSGQAFVYYATQNKYKAVFYIGPDKDLDIFINTDIDITKNINSEFDDAVLTGLTNNRNIAEDISTLELLLQKGRRLLCINPDIVVTTKNGLEYCAGKLAGIYADMGGKVIYFGKPYQEVYNIAKQMIQKHVENPKVLAIGDTMETDILGANRNGIDTALCINGIAQERIEKCGIEAFLAEFEYRPNYIIAEL